MAAGARRADAAWTRGGGREGLWVSVSRGPRTAADAAFAIVEREAPHEAVRVFDADDLDGRVRATYFAGVAEDVAGPEQQKAESFSTRQNVAIVVVCFLGAALVAGGRELTGGASLALQAAGWAVEALLLVVVVCAASGRGFSIPGAPRPGSEEPWRPLPLLGFLAVAAALLWQAVRGLD